VRGLPTKIIVFGLIAHFAGALVMYTHDQAPQYDLFPDHKQSTTAFIICDLFFKFSLALGFYVYQFAAKKSLLKFLLLTTIAFIGNDIIDELFCNPYKWQLNETLLLIVILISGGYYLCRINTTS